MSGGLDTLAAGMRLAVMVLAVMMILTRVKQLPGEASAGWAATQARAWQLNADGWTLMAMAALVFSVVRLARLFGHPLEHDLTRVGEVASTAMATAAFIFVIAARGYVRGLSAVRVRRGAIANLGVALLAVGAAWLIR